MIIFGVAFAFTNVLDRNAQGNHTEAEPLYRRSLAIQEQIFGPDHPTVAENCDDLAGVLVAQVRGRQAFLGKHSGHM